MLDIGLLGLIWAVGLFATWAGYYLVYMPKRIKNWILQYKWRVFSLDMFLIVMGNQILNQATGTIVAGIATMFFGIMCFAFSLSMLGYSWARNKVKRRSYA